MFQDSVEKWLDGYDGSWYAELIGLLLSVLWRLAYLFYDVTSG
jgi:hypothetical protein